MQERSAKERLLEQDKAEHTRSMERAKHSERLRLEAEAELHKQKMEDMRLTMAAERSARERELEKLQEEHKREMAREQNKDFLDHERQLGDVRVAEKKLQVEVDRDKVQVEKERLEFMKGLGIDVSKVLVAECKLPDKTIRVENTAGLPGAALHLHENNSSQL